MQQENTQQEVRLRKAFFSSKVKVTMEGEEPRLGY